jgi:uncharacterized protein HemY
MCRIPSSVISKEDDKRSVAYALVYLGNLVIDQGEYTRARSLLEDSQEMN